MGNVINDGVVQPGNSAIGSLNVNGNFTQHADGTTTIAINSAGNTAGVNNDHLNVTGHAALDGTLNVTAVGGGVFTSGTQYTIMNATGGVSGQYAAVTDNLSMFSIAATYDANDVPMELQRTSQPERSRDDDESKRCRHGSSTILRSSSSGSLFTMINTLGAETAAQQRQSLDQLSGSIFGNTQTLGLQVGDQFQQRLD